MLVRRQHALPWMSGSSRISHILRQDAAGMAVRQRASRPTQPEQPRRPRRRPRSQCKSIPSRTTARQRQLRPGYSDPLHYPQALDLVFAVRASRPQDAAALLRCCTAAPCPPPPSFRFADSSSLRLIFAWRRPPSCHLAIIYSSISSMRSGSCRLTPRSPSSASFLSCAGCSDLGARRSRPSHRLGLARI